VPDETITFRVWRGDPSGGQEVEYRVPAVTGMVVLDAMHYIQAYLDGDLAVRWNCKAAKCGSCSAEINGFPKLMCKTRIDGLPADAPIHVHPMRSFPVIRDLVTDVSWNYRVNKEIAPFTPAEDDGEPWIMYQEDVQRLYEPRKCIECFLCQNTCHVLRNHDDFAGYYGPRYMVRYQYLAMHPKDILDRREALKQKAGIGYCNITKCCQEVCPEHIHITDNAIIPLKERVADEYYDPIRWAIRKLTGGERKPEESTTGPGIVETPK